MLPLERYTVKTQIFVEFSSPQHSTAVQQRTACSHVYNGWHSPPQTQGSGEEAGQEVGQEVAEVARTEQERRVPAAAGWPANAK